MADTFDAAGAGPSIFPIDAFEALENSNAAEKLGQATVSSHADEASKPLPAVMAEASPRDLKLLIRVLTFRGF